tara:strand:- start:2280 stop:2666 length:387 start_codon:yes stop_codon:yes gene_type:complete
MTSTTQIKVKNSDNSFDGITQTDFQHCLRKGNFNGRRNFKIYQRQKVENIWIYTLILKKEHGIETRFNAKYPDKKIYEFHLGIKNIILSGKIYSPDGSMHFDVHTVETRNIEQMRFGRKYNNVLLEFI